MEADNVTKVIIADDQLLFADGLEEIINQTRGFKVIAKAGNGKMLLQILNSLAPDVIFLDIQMPLLDGLETALTIRKTQPNIKIIFISFEYNHLVKAFVDKNDIHGFIIKNVGAYELRQGLTDVMLGKKTLILPPKILPDFGETAFGASDFFNLYKLTKTEKEIIGLIVIGDSTKIIAEKRKLSPLTVESHRKNIFRKLHAKNVAEVVAFAIKHGLTTHNGFEL